MTPKQTPANDPAQAARPATLLETLQAMQDGRIHSELTSAHREVVEHMMKKGGKGRITITFDYERKDEKGISITADIAVKLPKKARRGEFLYATEDGKTFLDDPHEVELPFPSHTPAKLTITKQA